MPTLDFAGKAHARTLHEAEPVRALVVDPAKGVPGGDGNRIVQGDNLAVLKALLPGHAGTIDVIYTDPPYNTGQRGWRYDDAMRGQPGQGDRHDAWLAMMWPRLALMDALLAPDGLVLIHIDEHEAAALSLIGDEIFVGGGGRARYGTIVWDKGNPKGDATGLAHQHESILVWGPKRERGEAPLLRRAKPHAAAMLAAAARFAAEDGATASRRYAGWVAAQPGLSGGERPYRRIDHAGDVYRLVHMGWPNKKVPPADYFAPLPHPRTGEPAPMPARGWRYPSATLRRLMGEGPPVTEPDGSVTMGEIVFPADNRTQPQRKYRLKDALYEAVPTVLRSGASDDRLFDALGLHFDTPKPWPLAAQILGWVTKRDALVLDCFAGSGTTAHAVLALNAADGGRRRFILVESGDYADTLTAERVRRVIRGGEGIGAPLPGGFDYATLGDVATDRA